MKSLSKKMISIVIIIAFCVCTYFCFFASVPVVSAVTQNQQNIVDRADYLYNITWVAQKTISAHSYSYYYTYYQGNTYHLPYGQGDTSYYIGYGVTPEYFIEAAADPNSEFYAYKSYAGSWYSTYYITDCSGFVSWCWGLSAKQSTRSLANYSTYIASVTTNNIYNYLKVGDAINRYDYHVVLVTDLIYNSSGTLTGIEITEQTIPETTRTVYSPSGLAQAYASYDGIYRYNGTVPAAPVADEEKPVISDVKFSNVSAAGYTVTCTVTDNTSVSRVAFPTWTLANGQDDLASDFMNTQQGTKNGNTYSFNVKTSDHNNETGYYVTHIYAEDRAGNVTSLALNHVEVRDDTENPVISNVVYSNVSSAGYTISCTVTDDWGVSSVAFPTWTVANGQDDLPERFLTTQLGTKNGDVYTFNVKASDHNNETGSYVTHIYATDCAGNVVSLALNAVQVMDDTENPVISDVVVSNITADGYTVSCKVTDNWGVHSVAFPTWTVENGQDDLAEKFMTTQLGTKNGDTYTFHVKASDHNNETGAYLTHIYAKDCAGNTVQYVLTAIDVKDPVITLKSSSGYSIEEAVVYNIKEGTTVAALLDEFENTDLEVVDCSGNVISDAALVGTSAKVNLYCNDEITDTVTVIVLGDVDGNGIVDATDYLRVKSTCLGSFTLSDLETVAADIDGSGIIDANDHQKLREHLLGTYDWE